MDKYGNYPMVNTLVNLDAGRIYATENYEILKPLEGNRGQKNSVKSSKLKEFKELHKEGMFFAFTSVVWVNLDGFIIEGNNRKAMLEEMGEPIAFIVTDQPQFNTGSQSDILNMVAKYNSINSKWTGMDNFESAIQMNEPLAIEFENVKKLMLETFELKSITFLTPGFLYALATKDIKAIHGTSRERADFCNVELAEYAKTKEFQYMVKYMVKLNNLIDSFKIAGIKNRDVFKCILPLVWENKVPNAATLFELIEKDRFIKLKSLNNVYMRDVKRIIDNITYFARRK